MAIWRMRVACWIPKVTDAHSEYAILIVFPGAWGSVVVKALRY